MPDCNPALEQRIHRVPINSVMPPTSAVLHPEAAPKPPVLLQARHGGLYLIQHTYEEFCVLSQELTSFEDKDREKRNTLYIDVKDPEKEQPDEHQIPSGVKGNRVYSAQVKRHFGKPGFEFRVRSDAINRSCPFDEIQPAHLKVIVPDIGFYFLSTEWTGDEPSEVSTRDKLFEKALESLFRLKNGNGADPESVRLRIPGGGSFVINRSYVGALDAGIQKIISMVVRKALTAPPSSSGKSAELVVEESFEDFEPRPQPNQQAKATRPKSSPLSQVMTSTPSRETTEVNPPARNPESHFESRSENSPGSTQAGIEESLSAKSPKPQIKAIQGHHPTDERTYELVRLAWKSKSIPHPAPTMARFLDIVTTRLFPRPGTSINFESLHLYLVPVRESPWKFSKHIREDVTKARLDYDELTVEREYQDFLACFGHDKHIVVVKLFVSGECFLVIRRILTGHAPRT